MKHYTNNILTEVVNASGIVRMSGNDSDMTYISSSKAEQPSQNRSITSNVIPEIQQAVNETIQETSSINVDI